jgi:hypothetical protein
MHKSLASLVLFALTASVGSANAAECTNLPDPTTFADLTTADGSPSKSTGGDVTDGTYVFTGALIYNTGLPPGFVLGTEGITISLAAGMYESISQPLDGTAMGESGSVTFDSASATAAITPDCPEGTPPTSAGYSSDGTTVVLVFDAGGGIMVEETVVHQ